MVPGPQGGLGLGCGHVVVFVYVYERPLGENQKYPEGGGAQVDGQTGQKESWPKRYGAGEIRFGKSIGNGA